MVTPAESDVVGFVCGLVETDDVTKAAFATELDACDRMTGRLLRACQ